jgi:acyl-homoserine lactone acylase PvdQ
MHTTRSFASISLLLSTLVLAASAQENLPAVDGAGRYEATIRRTSYGIPHIAATDLASLGFGEGYAQAEDHLCTIDDQVVRRRGERAKYFGRGEGDRHVLSDIAAKAMRAREDADSGRAAEPQEVRDWLGGFVAGYNLYLERTGRDALPGWCRGQDWVFPITPADLALEYTADGPRAMAFLTYSQSGDPESPHFTDQTELFARKQWRPIPFCAADIAADVKREYTVRAPRTR